MNDDELFEWEDKFASDLIVGDLVQDLGRVEDIERIPMTTGQKYSRYEIDFWSISRGGTTRRMRADQRVKVRVNG